MRGEFLRLGVNVFRAGWVSATLEIQGDLSIPWDTNPDDDMEFAVAVPGGVYVNYNDLYDLDGLKWVDWWLYNRWTRSR